MYGLAKLAMDYQKIKTEDLEPEFEPVEFEPSNAPNNPPMITTAHLQALDLVDDGYRLFRMINR